MALIQDWLPPTRENYELILTMFKFGYPIVSAPTNPPSLHHH